MIYLLLSLYMNAIVSRISIPGALSIRFDSIKRSAILGENYIDILKTHRKLKQKHMVKAEEKEKINYSKELCN